MIYLGMTGGGLKHKETYFVTVIAINKVGLKTAAYSAPLVVDTTPPRVGVCVCACVRMYWRACVLAYMHTCIHAYMYTFIHACMLVYINARMHMCLYACVHACMYACICIN